ncbi:paired amphipathic helix Sin3a isoform X2, partial [Brachionus plicatilis]
EDLYRLFYVDEHWYLFFRYHQILCERLLRIYRHAQKLSEQEQIEAKSRDQSAAEMLKLRSKLEVSVDDYYPAFLDIVRNLLDGNMDSVQYEDTLREMFGIYAYIAFTLDKVVHNCVRQLQFLVQDEKSCSVKQFFTEEQKNPQSGSKVSHMSCQSVINSEMNYQKKIESLLSDQNIYKMITYKNSCRLTIELLDTQKEEDEDEEMGDEAEAPKWSEFVHKHCTVNEIDQDLKARLAKRPVFLTRNAHILKLRFNVYPTEEVEKKEDSICRKQINETSTLYRRNGLKHAQKSHLKVTKKMYDKFRKYLTKWLKEHMTPADCIDDWLMGEDLKDVRTTIQKEVSHKKPPYHVLYKYKVESESANTQQPAPPH